MDAKRQPGDVFLDRYMPGASEKEREEARQNLYGFFAVLLEIATRRATEDYAKGIRAKGRGAVESGNGAPPSP
ncbi:MAG: hypothetical protein WDM89_22215 [Rhizomicrobium sp.]